MPKLKKYIKENMPDEYSRLVKDWGTPLGRGTVAPDPDSTTKKPAEELDERLLDDDFPVYAGYVYVIDGRPLYAMITGTVAALKRDVREHYDLPGEEVRACDLAGRGIL